MKLSEPMIRVLRNLHGGFASGNHLRGMAQHGGHVAVMCALRRRGLIDYDDCMTQRGRDALAEYDRKSSPLANPAKE